MMKSRCRENTRKGKREIKYEKKREIQKREEKEKKKRLNGAMGKERDFSPIVHTVASLSAPLHVPLPLHRHGTHTSLRNEPDYWLNPDRGITYSVKSSFSRGEPERRKHER